MNKPRIVLTTVLALLAIALPAAALSPDEVAIIANARSEESLELAKLYSSVRDIPEEHIIEIRTTTRPRISREDYEKDILHPVRQALVDRGLQNNIRCLAFMWGVPLRVAAPAESELLSVYRTAAERAHYRLATNYKLVPSVARDFPQPRTNALEPIADLFDQPLPQVSEPLMELPKLLEDFDRLLTSKTRQVRRIEDPERRAIANQQLMGLFMDSAGLEGLLRYVRANEVADAPPPQALEQQISELRSQYEQAGRQAPSPENADKKLELMERLFGNARVATYAGQRASQLEPDKDSSASVDSEMALLWRGPYPLKNWMPNPLNWRDRIRMLQQGQRPQPTLMTARIDGPTPDDARRIIRVSHQVEQEGLQGIFYIDADLEDSRNPKFDELLVELHRFVRDGTDFPTELNTSHEVFQPGDCPDAALYVGWYKLRQYVPAFTWMPGAVGYHVASFEAQNLRDPDTSEWCAKMIQNGVVATMGAVDEPYLGAFPQPNEFFPLLMTGEFTVAEAYWLTSTTTSWRMTLIADPLYNPFKANPQLKLEDLPEGILPVDSEGNLPDPIVPTH